MTTEGEIVGLSSYYHPEPSLDITPQITAEEALSTVMQALGIDTTQDVSASTAVQPLDPETSSQSGTCASYLLLGLEDPFKPVLLGPELVIYPDAKCKKSVNLAWKIAYSGQNAGSWEYFIDAHTGEIISSQDVRIPLNFTTEGYYKAKYFPTDGDDDLSTSPLANSDVLTQYYYYGYNDYEDDTSSPTSGYYEVDYNYGYYWYRLLFLMNGPKCWVIVIGMVVILFIILISILIFRKKGILPGTRTLIIPIHSLIVKMSAGISTTAFTTSIRKIRDLALDIGLSVTPIIIPELLYATMIRQANR